MRVGKRREERDMQRMQRVYEENVRLYRKDSRFCISQKKEVVYSDP